MSEIRPKCQSIVRERCFCNVRSRCQIRPQHQGKPRESAIASAFPYNRSFAADAPLDLQQICGCMPCGGGGGLDALAALAYRTNPSISCMGGASRVRDRRVSAIFPGVTFPDLGLCRARTAKGLENRTRSQFSCIGRRRNAPDSRVSAIPCTRCAVKCDSLRGWEGSFAPDRRVSAIGVTLLRLWIGCRRLLSLALVRAGLLM